MNYDMYDESTQKAINAHPFERFFNSEHGRVWVMPTYFLKEVATGKVTALNFPFIVLNVFPRDSEGFRKVIIWTCEPYVKVGGNYVDQCDPTAKIEIRDTDRLGGAL